MDKNIINEKILINKYIECIINWLDLLINLKDKSNNTAIIEFYLKEINNYFKIVVEKLQYVL